MTKIVVREGQLVVPTCPECGCRLERLGDTYEHFRPYHWWVKKDARGCQCELVSVSFIILEKKVTPMWHSTIRGVV